MSYEHQLIKTFDGQESYAYFRGIIKTSPASIRACSLLGIHPDEFSATPDFLPLPHLSCKAHRGDSIEKMSVAAQQKAHDSCPDGLPVCLGQRYSHNPATPVV